MKSAMFGLMVGILAAAAVAAPTYTGSLSWSGGGITGTPGSPWLDEGTALSWEVTANGNGTFTYWYKLTVADDPDISHLIIEVSPTFTGDNISDEKLYDTTVVREGPVSYDESGSNPGMPSEVFGVKFEVAEGSTYDSEVWTVEFVSDRVPVWGDFYAKGGRTTGIWNAGFTAADPQAAPANGSLDGHLLVPDTTVIIPVPGALGLAVLGLGLVASRRR